MLRKLWNDEAGAILSAEIVLVATILVIGMIVGLKSVRDAVVSELADVAQAFANIDQSYSYSAVDGHGAFTEGATFADSPDFCDDPALDEDVDVLPRSKCVSVCDADDGAEGPSA
ncbi:MAG: hypothetical protein KDA42_05665 [Planctomycetales bacterium]|nr:hypothetical protein [Planctomycetales bacterium]